MSGKIKVLIVDDSAFIRILLTKALTSSNEIEVVGAAEDPIVAAEMIKQTKPDVLTLDIEMPKMDGITFLKQLMRDKPMPVIMISSLTKKGASVTLKAMEYGAVDFVTKPEADVKDNLLSYSGILVDKVKAAARANVRHSIAPAVARPVTSKPTVKAEPEPELPLRIVTSSTAHIDLIAIGASTGGTEAIKSVLTNLPTDFPPIVMAQHIPPLFSTSFANRLNDHSKLQVIEPTENMPLKRGHAYLAPGDKHLVVRIKGGQLYAVIDDGVPVNRHKPSVEVLFRSVANTVRNNCAVVMLTGMGADGAQAMKTLYDQGAHTIAQDKASSVVWGMPGAAVQLNGASEQLPLNKIANRLIQLVHKK